MRVDGLPAATRPPGRRGLLPAQKTMPIDKRSWRLKAPAPHTSPNEWSYAVMSKNAVSGKGVTFFDLLLVLCLTRLWKSQESVCGKQPARLGTKVRRGGANLPPGAGEGIPRPRF